ncbi:hypothetical protein HHI36_010287, partial [Cryptolaemus montrouzieri]
VGTSYTMTKPTFIVLTRNQNLGKCLKSPMVKGKRFIIFQAEEKAGFVPNAELLFKSGLKTGNYHDDMNHMNYMQWLEKKLIPNFPANFVLYSRQPKERPRQNKYSRRQKI